MNLKQLYHSCPSNLQEDLVKLWNVPQNPQWHPEGNTLKHVILTVRRALDVGDIDLIMAALFHDLGKFETLAFKIDTKMPTAYGHEKVSAWKVFIHRHWIKSMGANPEKVYWIVKNHMRIKFIDEMRPGKRRNLTDHRWYESLVLFKEKIDYGGY